MPVLGLIFGVVLLGEELAVLQYIGAALVITGIVIARMRTTFELKMITNNK
ncbi:MAG: hypothetical protein WD361_01865 [Gracilimonas sp.]